MTESSEYRSKYNKIMLDTFRYLVDFLNAHNLRWFCSYGTLIGAVRHQGLIPWDDDIDICMPKDDFDRLVSIKDEIENNSHYRIVSILDKGYYYAIGKIIDTNTTLWEDEIYPFITGVYVDIFPLYKTLYTGDKLIETRKNFESLYISCIRTVKKIPFKSFFRSLFVDHSRVWREYIINKIVYPKYRHNYFLKKFKEYDNQLNNNTGDSALCYACFEYKEVTKAEYYSGYLEVPFEDFKVKIPIGYHEILSNIYGDYMTPPPVDKRKSRHNSMRYYINLKEGLTISEAKKRIKKGERQLY